VAAPVLGNRPAARLLIAVPGGIEDYFHEINTASTDDERHRIGKRYDIRMIRDEQRTCACPWLIPAQNDLPCAGTRSGT
jgi:hypothetical protein